MIMHCDLLTVSGSTWPGVQYFCSTRAGGLSLPPYDSLNLGTHVNDHPECVEGNRARLQNLLPAPPRWLEQVHGVDVVQFSDNASALNVQPPPRADAAITTVPNCVLAILTADCLPVVISDDDATVLGVAHAGWRGLAGGVLENTITAMGKHLGKSNGLKAWIGPGISQAAFEVGPEVRAAFVEADSHTAPYFVASTRGSYLAGDGQSAKWKADLAGLARYRLTKAGVSEVALSGRCTFYEPELFYSYRRTPRTGRMATVAWLRNASD